MESLSNITIRDARRELVARSLHEFVKYFWKTFDGAKFIDNWLIEYQAECFQWTVRRFLPAVLTQDYLSDEGYQTIKRLTGGACSFREKDTNNHDFNMPPRHGKSTVLSVCGPVWINTVTPSGVEVVSVSHVKTLAIDFNTKRQKILNSPEYRNLFGSYKNLEIVQNSSSRLELQGGGKMYTTAMKSFLGSGGDIIINDDIVSSEDARKDKEVLLNAREYWRDTLPTRRNQGERSIVWNIMQRLNTSDISGMIEGDEALRKVYTKTVIKAIAEDDEVIIFPCSGKVHKRKKGQSLWPGRFGNYDNLKLEVGNGVFETQYQQNPINSDMTVFQADMINWVHPDDIAPADFKMEYFSVDFPVKDRETSDLTGAVKGEKTYSILDITDATCERMSYPLQKQMCLDVYNNEPSRIHLYEDKANGAVLVQDLKLDIPGIIPFNPGSRSKRQRAEIASIYVEANVRFVLNRDGSQPRNLQRLVDELVAFPFVKHDDLTDAFVQLILFTYSDLEHRIYSRAFTQANAVSLLDGAEMAQGHPVDVGINYLNGAYFAVKVAVDYRHDRFIVMSELHTESLEELLAFTKGTRVAITVTEETADVLGLKLVSYPITFDYLKMIEGLKNALNYNRMIFMFEACPLTVSSINTQRYTPASVKTRTYTPFAGRDDFAGCVRAVLASIKGETAFFLH